MTVKIHVFDSAILRPSATEQFFQARRNVKTLMPGVFVTPAEQISWCVLRTAEQAGQDTVKHLTPEGGLSRDASHSSAGHQDSRSNCIWHEERNDLALIKFCLVCLFWVEGERGGGGWGGAHSMTVASGVISRKTARKLANKQTRGGGLAVQHVRLKRNAPGSL